jgi:hypothetical protein
VKELCLYCREYLHSFSTTIVAFTAALSGTATGFTALSYMDELYVLFQVVVIFYCLIKFDKVLSIWFNILVYDCIPTFTDHSCR